jgi:hypothetical protein
MFRGLRSRSRSLYDLLSPRAVLISAVRDRTIPDRAGSPGVGADIVMESIALIDVSFSIGARLLTPGMKMFSTSEDRNVYDCGGTMLA